MIQSYSKMDRAAKIRAAEIMYGTDSKQHRAARDLWEQGYRGEDAPENVDRDPHTGLRRRPGFDEVPPDWGTDEGDAMRAITNEGHADCCQCELCVVQETDVVDPETRWATFGQCGECNEPDRIMSQTRGLCVTCDAHLRGEW